MSTQYFYINDDIAVEAKVLLIKYLGANSFKPQLKVSLIVFRTFCNFAQILGIDEIKQVLDSEFGVGKWHNRYENYKNQNSNY